MNESWLRDALREATSRQPHVGDRTPGVFARVTRRRQQRAVAVSCVTALAVLFGVASMRGADSVSLDPTVPIHTPSGTESPAEAAHPASTTSPTSTQEPDPEPEPSRTAGTTAGPRATAPPAAPPDVPRGGKLDVYVLLDTTSSMVSAESALDPALKAIHERLRREGFDVAWGLGVFRDTQPELPETRAYERVRAIAPDGTMNSTGVRYGGGDTNPAEAMTMGLHGAVGVGHFPYTSDTEAAGFRPDARKLVLLVTDAPSMEGDPHPSVEQVAEDLRARGVRVAALHVLTENDPRSARADLDLVARGTGGLAEGPVDCDGDPGHELSRGDPLVCELPSRKAQDLSGFGDALADMARRASW